MTTNDTESRPQEEAALWKRHFKVRDAASRDAIILRYVPLVHFVLGRLGFSPALGPEYEDMHGGVAVPMGSGDRSGTGDLPYLVGLDDVALLDDIATLLDDISILTKVAAKKTAGVLGDDLALNAQQVAGVNADRELPVVWAVARGSFVNKAILVPAALAISVAAPTRMRRIRGPVLRAILPRAPPMSVPSNAPRPTIRP